MKIITNFSTCFVDHYWIDWISAVGIIDSFPISFWSNIVITRLIFDQLRWLLVSSYPWNSVADRKYGVYSTDGRNPLNFFSFFFIRIWMAHIAYTRYKYTFLNTYLLASSVFAILCGILIFPKLIRSWLEHGRLFVTLIMGCIIGGPFSPHHPPS